MGALVGVEKGKMAGIFQLQWEGRKLRWSMGVEQRWWMGRVPG
jgi:hypothetical protein